MHTIGALILEHFKLSNDFHFWLLNEFYTRPIGKFAHILRLNLVESLFLENVFINPFSPLRNILYNYSDF